MTAPQNGTIRRRKPRIALMGEFSAGKSTLTNLLIGSRAIPMRVTATQLPPVWIALGAKAPYREDLDGNKTPVDLTRIEDVPVEDTRFIRLFKPTSEILEVCDIIDLPGISDPNMAADVWHRALEHSDGVIWLTHATQAWRQSEAAVWDELAAEFSAKSLLLLTRMDKIIAERDKVRVVKRVEKETAGLFRAVLPISLSAAMEAKGDQAKWATSGAEAFNNALIDLIGDLVGAGSAETATDFPAQPKATPAPRAAPPQTPLRVQSDTAGAPAEKPSLRVQPKPDDAQTLRVKPRDAAPAAAQPLRVTPKPAPAAPDGPPLRVTPKPAPAAPGASVMPRRVTVRSPGQNRPNS